MKTLGIIDIGSNSIKLLIVKINKDKSYEGVYNKKFQTRLSDYISGDKQELSLVGAKNFFGIISTFNVICKQFNCDDIIAVGTESLRNIKNAHDLIEDIYTSLRIQIKILSPKEECYYGYLSSTPSNITNYVHLDIGGGSIEIGLVKDKKLINCDSISMGALNITKTFDLKQNSVENNIKASNYLIKTLKNIPWINECKNIPIIVIGGSIKTIGRILSMEYNTTMNIHDYEISTNDINSLLNKISKMTVSEIVTSTGVSKTRGDILLGALLITNNILSFLNSPKLLISQYTIRDGIIKDYINKNKKI